MDNVYGGADVNFSSSVMKKNTGTLICVSKEDFIDMREELAAQMLMSHHYTKGQTIKLRKLRSLSKI